jgi:hypothetical protein
MLQFNKSIVAVTGAKQPHFDNANQSSAGTYHWRCNGCKEGVGISLKEVLDDSLFSSVPGLTAAEEAQARAHFALAARQYARAHCGGWSNFRIYPCLKCAHQFLVYLGMNEVSNSHYLITVHSVWEVTRSN